MTFLDKHVSGQSSQLDPDQEPWGHASILACNGRMNWFRPICLAHKYEGNFCMTLTPEFWSCVTVTKESPASYHEKKKCPAYGKIKYTGFSLPIMLHRGNSSFLKILWTELLMILEFSSVWPDVHSKLSSKDQAK